MILLCFHVSVFMKSNLGITPCFTCTFYKFPLTNSSLNPNVIGAVPWLSSRTYPRLFPSSWGRGWGVTLGGLSKRSFPWCDVIIRRPSGLDSFVVSDGPPGEWGTYTGRRRRRQLLEIPTVRGKVRLSVFVMSWTFVYVVELLCD